MEPNFKKFILSIVVSTILLFSGCIDSIKQQAQEVSSDIIDITKEFGTTYEKFIHDFEDIDGEQYINEKNIASSISTLEPINGYLITSYFDVSDAFCDLFSILNDEGGYDIPIPKNEDEYNKISKFVTEWSPIIKEYNNTIYSARNYDETDEESKKEFRKCIALLGLEFAIIYMMVWYKPAFWTVGKVYRWSGLNKLAFSHPKIVSVVLSKAHWGVRAAMVDKTTESVDSLFGWLENLN